MNETVVRKTKKCQTNKQNSVDHDMCLLRPTDTGVYMYSNCKLSKVYIKVTMIILVHTASTQPLFPQTTVFYCELIYRHIKCHIHPIKFCNILV